jgi:UDP-glucose 4-epimerase
MAVQRSRRCFVTGGAGFVGASLVRALEARGDEVTVLDDGRSAGFRWLEGTGVRLVAGDVADVGLLERIVPGHDAVVHLAARTSVPGSIAVPLDDLAQNVSASVGLLDVCRRSGIERFVFASSNAAAGMVDGPVDEGSPTRPVSPYGAAKLAVEGYLRAYHRAYGLCGTAVRFSNGYGPYSLHKGSVVAAFLRAAVTGEALRVYGDGRQTRDLVHVDDLVALVVRVLDAPRELVSGETFQAGSGRSTSVLELARRVVELCGGGVAIHHEPARRGDVVSSSSDIGKARQVLDYEPAVTLDEGLSRTLDWFEAASRPASAVPR